MLSCSIWLSAPSFWMGGGLESRCVGRVYGADVVWFCFFYDSREIRDRYSVRKFVYCFLLRLEAIYRLGVDLTRQNVSALLI